MIHTTMPTRIEISQRAFEHNVATYKKLIGPSVNLAVVVKSNAYGHGLTEIGKLCQQSAHVQWLCTSSLSEALTLRAQGITKPILVMSLIDADPAQAIMHDIDLMVYTKTMLTTLNNIGALLKRPAHAHIKIDTGMSRFGVRNQEILDLITYALQLPYITVRGLYTHLSESDNEDETFTREQLAQFDHIVHMLKTHTISIPIIHASNSTGTANLMHSHFNLVRIGAGAYGLWASPTSKAKIQATIPHFDLQPVMTWKTTIMDTRTLPAHAYVGYRRTHQTTQPTRMGIIPIGYYEGYDRRLSNKGITVIAENDQEISYAPIMGRICMNISMIDITNSTADIGSTVILLGDYDQVRAGEIADRIESFNPREITTRLNPLIPRIIVP
ncbi:MAG: alanine racemase [Candidatus Babeliales bacterium]